MKIEFKTSREKICLNYMLILKQKLSEDDVKEIKKLHKKKSKLFDKLETTKDPAVLKEIENCEFELQEKWGFKQDASYHDWFEVPGCSCAKLDNLDAKGTGLRYFSGNCPWHGKIACNCPEME